MQKVPKMSEETALTILRFFMKTSVPRIIAEEKNKAKAV